MEVFLYIILGLFIAFLSLRMVITMVAKRQKGNPVPELSGKYKKISQSKTKSLLYFYGPTCPPCQQMTPIVDNLSKNHKNIYKIDISRDMDIARKFGIMGTPSVVVVDKGVIADVLFGPQSESSLSKAL